MSNGPLEPEIMQPDKISESFGSREVSVVRETAATAVAAQAMAAIQARYVMALQRPRDWDNVRVKLLKECRRPTFAAVARYRKPIGKGIEGPSIRFAEAAVRCMGNILAESTVVYDDPEKRILRINVTDLEGNANYPTEVVIEKTVERRKLQDGDKPLRTRTNSYGDTLYILPATEDDLLNKQNAAISKAIRTNALRLLPGDILDECMEIVKEIVAKKITDDPDAARKQIADAFAALNIQPSELKRYLGCDLGQATPAQLDELRAIYTTLKDGETTWRSVMDSLEDKPDPDGNGGGKTQGSDLREKIDKAKERLAKKTNDAPREGGEASKAAGSDLPLDPAGDPAPESNGVATPEPDPSAEDQLTDEQLLQCEVAAHDAAIERHGKTATQAQERALRDRALFKLQLKTVRQLKQKQLREYLGHVENEGRPAGNGK